MNNWSLKKSEKRTKLFFTTFYAFLSIVILFYGVDCSKALDPQAEPFNQKNYMVVYANIGNIFHLLNHKTLKIEKTVKLDIPDSIGCFGMCVSTNKDYLIFAAQELAPPFKQFIVSYDITNDTLHNIFATGLDSFGAPRMEAAHQPDEPGLFYVYSHRSGLYSIDFLKNKITLLSDEYNQGLSKLIYFSPNENMVALLRQQGGDETYATIEIFNSLSILGNPQIVLNENNSDSIYVSDLRFSHDMESIYLSIRVPKLRGIGNYFGSYSLRNKELEIAPFVLPWSINPYYLSYNPMRQEIYMVGEQDKMFVINLMGEQYAIKTVIDLPGKVFGPSRIALDPNENIAFVSCSRSDFVLAVDLKTHQVRQKIPVERPYLIYLL